MKRKMLSLVVIPLVALLCVKLGYIIGTSVAKANNPSTSEGLPLAFDVKSNDLVNGQRIVVFRSEPFVPTSEDDIDLMSDIPNQLGRYHSAAFGTVAWIYAPDGKTLSIFPKYVTDATPSVSADVQAYVAAHPDLSLVSQSEVFYRYDDTQWVAVSNLQRLPSPNCPNKVSHPYVVEYHATFGGNVANFIVPETLVSNIYRVPQN